MIGPKRDRLRADTQALLAGQAFVAPRNAAAGRMPSSWSLVLLARGGSGQDRRALTRSNDSVRTVLIVQNSAFKLSPPTPSESHMKSMAASDARQSFASLIDAAAREPVVIRRQRRDVAVVLSMPEYRRLTHLNVAEFQRFCDQIGQRATDAGLTENELNQLLNAPGDG